MKVRVTSGRAPRRQAGEAASSILACFVVAGLRPDVTGDSSENKHADRLFPPEEMLGWRSAGMLLSTRSGDEPPQPCAITPLGENLVLGVAKGARHGRRPLQESGCGNGCAIEMPGWCGGELLRL
jgi:hypothetical protein